METPPRTGRKSEIRREVEDFAAEQNERIDLFILAIGITWAITRIRLSDRCLKVNACSSRCA
jgi:hypothetical protein